MRTYFQIKQALEDYDKHKGPHRQRLGDEANIKKLRAFFNTLTPTEHIDYELSQRQTDELGKLIKSNTTVADSASRHAFDMLNSASSSEEEQMKASTFLSTCESEELSDEKKNNIYLNVKRMLDGFDARKSIFGFLNKEDKDIRHLRKIFSRISPGHVTTDQLYELTCLFTFSNKSDDEWSQLCGQGMWGITNCKEFINFPSLPAEKSINRFTLDHYVFYLTYYDIFYKMTHKIYDRLKLYQLLDKKYTDNIIAQVNSGSWWGLAEDYLLKRIDDVHFLHDNNLLNEHILKVLKITPYSSDLREAIENLMKANVPEKLWRLAIHEPLDRYMSQGRRYQYTSFHYSFNLSCSLAIAHKDGFINDNNAKFILDHCQHPPHFFDVWILFCRRGGIYHGEQGIANLGAIINYTNQGNVYGMRHIFSSLQNLNQLDLQHLTRFRGVWEYNAVFYSLRHIPDHILTQDLFNRLIRLCEQHARNRGIDTIDPLDEVRDATLVTAITNAINNAIRQEANMAGPEINAQQSTHEVSVHESVSDSAVKLKDHYGALINTEKKRADTLKEITDYFDGLPDSDDLLNQEAAAKRAIIRILNGDLADFVDRRSNLSTRDIILLTWLAIHDATSCLCPLPDALKRYVIGFYDCQRGYNLNTKSIDLGGADKPICTPGTFNKIISSLWGIHPDVDLKFITKDTANLKLRALIKECAADYLKSLTAKERLQIIKLWDDKSDPESDDVNVAYRASELIWEKIQGDVANTMRDFGYEAAFADKQELYKTIETTGITALETTVNDEWVLDILLKPYRMPDTFVSTQSLFNPKLPLSSQLPSLDPAQMERDTSHLFATAAARAILQHSNNQSLSSTLKSVQAWLSHYHTHPQQEHALNALQVITNNASQELKPLKVLLARIFLVMYESNNLTAGEPEHRMDHLIGLINWLAACDTDYLNPASKDINKAYRELINIAWPTFKDPALLNSGTNAFNNALTSVTHNTLTTYLELLNSEQRNKIYSLPDDERESLLWSKIEPWIKQTLIDNGYLAVFGHDDIRLSAAIKESGKNLLKDKVQALASNDSGINARPDI